MRAAVRLDHSKSDYANAVLTFFLAEISNSARVVGRGGGYISPRQLFSTSDFIRSCVLFSRFSLNDFVNEVVALDSFLLRSSR